MKTTFVILSALAAVGMASPAPNADLVARGLALVEKQEKCHECIDNCNDIGGFGEAACKVVICAIECVITDS